MNMNITGKPYTAIIVQARLGSSRLPGKVLKEIEGKTMLGWVITRLQNAKQPDDIIIATTTSEKDEAIVEEAKKYGVKYFRGNEDDVLDRYYQTAKHFGVELIGRVTSDCPLIDPELIDEVLANFLSNFDKYDFCANTLKRTYPRGIGFSFVKFSALEKAWREAKQPYERVHVMPYIREHPGIFSLCSYEKEGKPLNHLRWTVDTEEDLQFVREIFKRLKNPGTAKWTDVLEIIEQEPGLMEINKNIKQKNLKDL